MVEDSSWVKAALGVLTGFPFPAKAEVRLADDSATRLQEGQRSWPGTGIMPTGRGGDGDTQDKHRWRWRGSPSTAAVGGRTRQRGWSALGRGG